MPFCKAPLVNDLGWLCLPFFALVIVGCSNAVNLTAEGYGMEEAIRAWRRQHRDRLRWRSSFSYGGGRGVARLPADLAASLAEVLLAFLTLAELVEQAKPS